MHIPSEEPPQKEAVRNARAVCGETRTYGSLGREREQFRFLTRLLNAAEMATPAYVSAFVQRINSIRPRRPVQVITFDQEGAFPDQMVADPSVSPIERRAVGFDERKLEEIAALLQ